MKKTDGNIDSPHLFAFYSESSLEKAFFLEQEQLFIVCENTELWHRFSHVLRFSPGDCYQLFDKDFIYTLSLHELSKSSLARVTGRLLDKQPVVKINPEITLIVGLTKKESFGELAYAAGQLGIDRIVPLLSQKIHKNWWSEKEKERLYEKIRAGAEQAKSYVVSTLETPLLYEQLLQSFSSQSGSYQELLVLEPSASESLFSYLIGHKQALSKVSELTNNYVQKITLFIGPEGGFTSKELEEIRGLGARFVSLTEQILRTQDAVLLSVGIIRAAIF